MSLKYAVHLALEKNKSVEASAAARNVAERRIAEARAGNLPKVNYSESWTRSDNPAFIFGSLLTQHQFGEQNFQIGSLNRPDFLNNFQSQITADQSLYDAGQTRHAVRSAELMKDMTGEGGRRTQMDLRGRYRTRYAGSLRRIRGRVTSSGCGKGRYRAHSAAGPCHAIRSGAHTESEDCRTRRTPGRARTIGACRKVD